nr:transposon Ty3-I gap-Pol polyprotein-like [Haemonchus contortus]
MEEQYNRHHGARQRKFNIGDSVWAKDYRSGAPKQAPGEVVQQYGNRLYDISVDGQIWKRHANQLRLRFSSNPNITETPTELVELPLLPMSRSANVTEEASSMLPTTTAEARPPQAIAGERRTRSRRRPEQLMVDPKKKTYA